MLTKQEKYCTKKFCSRKSIKSILLFCLHGVIRRGRPNPPPSPQKINLIEGPSETTEVFTFQILDINILASASYS